MKIPAHIVPFWDSFIQTQAEDPTPRFFEACHFDDNDKAPTNSLCLFCLAPREQQPVSSGPLRRRRYHCQRLVT